MENDKCLNSQLSLHTAVVHVYRDFNFSSVESEGQFLYFYEYI